MSDQTGIEWATRTWNPLAGCSPVSPGCANCYAAKMSRRLDAMGQEKYSGTFNPVTKHWSGKINFDPKTLDRPQRWRTKTERVFVNSMSDLFHEDVSTNLIDLIFAAMAAAPHCNFLILTKRPQGMFNYTSSHYKPGSINDAAILHSDKYQDHHIPQYSGPWPLANVWLGVSVENQKTADERIPWLLKCPAAGRFVSYEPMLGPVPFDSTPHGGPPRWLSPEIDHPEDKRIDWLICGGESGPNARPMHPDWARKALNQFVAAGVPIFFKQNGEWVEFYDQPESVLPPWHPDFRALANKPSCYVTPSGKVSNVARHGSLKIVRVGKKRAGHLLDGKEYFQIPKGLKHAAASTSR